MMVIPNALKDERFADNPFVAGDFHLCFYAGVPIHGPKGNGIGSFCLVDTKPRELSAKQIGQLKKFAAIVEAEIQH
jgi:GAF domain-containing protein